MSIQPGDFIMKTLRDQCLQGGCTERDANECASEGVRKWKRGGKSVDILKIASKPYIKRAKKK